MALDDYDHEVFSVTPNPNRKKDPLTGLEIDPEGLTDAWFSMRITNRVTGKFINRADYHSAISEETLRAYAEGQAFVMEQNRLAQTRDGVPSPLIGKRPVITPKPIILPTDDEKAIKAFRVLVMDWLTLRKAFEAKSPKVTQEDVDAAEAAWKQAFAPLDDKGVPVPVSDELAKEFNQILAAMTSVK